MTRDDDDCIPAKSILNIMFLKELRSRDNLILSLREFQKLGPKYLTHVSPYDLVLHLGIDKI